MRILKKMFKWLFMTTATAVFLLALVFVLMQTKPFERLTLAKGYKPLIVLSGSMEPAIRVGSVVLVREVKLSQIRAGDVVTFKTPVKPGEILTEERTFTTHRVTKVSNSNGRLSFETKGDANKGTDAWKVAPDDILGRVRLSIPYLGYFSHFARRPAGFILLLIIPGLLIIMAEIRNILLQTRLAKGTADA